MSHGVGLPCITFVVAYIIVIHYQIVFISRFHWHIFCSFMLQLQVLLAWTGIVALRCQPLTVMCLDRICLLLMVVGLFIKL